MWADRLSMKRLPILLCVSVALLATAVYVNSLGNGFAYDDETILQNREVLHSLANIGELVTAEYWPAMFHSALYRPLTLLSFAVDWAVWKGSPFGFHLVNVALHAFVAALVALLLLRLFPWWAALAGGAVFAVHPVHTEAVANVVGRGELLVALFALTACLVYVRAVRSERISLSAVFLISGLYALACFSKELGVVLPGLLLATDLPLLNGNGREKLKRFVRTRTPLFASLALVLAVVLAVRWAVLGAALRSVPDRAFAIDSSFITRVFTMARVWVRYFELLLFPVDLSADYSPAVIMPAHGLTAMGALGLVMVLGTVAIAVATFRRVPELLMAVMWAAVSLAPVSNLIFTAEIVLAERTLYLPSVAISILVALALATTHSVRRRWVGIGIATWILAFSAVTIQRNPVWDSTEAVFDDIRRKHPESSRMLWEFGHRYRRGGNWEKAKGFFDRSLVVWPHYAPNLFDYAGMLAREGELEKADSLAAMALELKPENRQFHRLHALVRLRRGDYQGTLHIVDRGLNVVGPDQVLFTLRAEAYAQLNDFERAAVAQGRAIHEAERSSWNAWHRLAWLRIMAGDTAAALVALDSARLTADADKTIADSLAREWRADR